MVILKYACFKVCQLSRAALRGYLDLLGLSTTLLTGPNPFVSIHKLYSSMNLRDHQSYHSESFEHPLSPGCFISGTWRSWMNSSFFHPLKVAPSRWWNMIGPHKSDFWWLISILMLMYKFSTILRHSRLASSGKIDKLMTSWEFQCHHSKSDPEGGASCSRVHGMDILRAGTTSTLALAETATARWRAGILTEKIGIVNGEHSHSYPWFISITKPILYFKYFTLFHTSP